MGGCVIYSWWHLSRSVQHLFKELHLHGAAGSVYFGFRV